MYVIPRISNRILDFFWELFMYLCNSTRISSYFLDNLSFFFNFRPRMKKKSSSTGVIQVLLYYVLWLQIEKLVKIVR